MLSFSKLDQKYHFPILCEKDAKNASIKKVGRKKWTIFHTESKPFFRLIDLFGNKNGQSKFNNL